MPWRVAIAFSFLFASPLAALAQSSSLSDYLKQTKIEPPFLVVAPDSVQANQKGTGLAQFGRKLIRVGELAAIVPETMVVFDEKLTKEPDFYEGLPRRSKVIYLLALLNKGQWDKAVGKGIGLNDLSGEQRNVFMSLLPKPLKWSTTKVDKEGFPSDPIEPQVLSGNALNQVRLRLTRGLTIVPIAGRSFFYMDIGGAGQTPGATVKVREDAEDMNEGMLYGLQIRKTVANTAKPSDIAYSDLTWNTKITLKDQVTIGDILKEVGTAAGKQLLASPYIASLTVHSMGGSVRAGDVLQALAQCVTGAYRRVGQAFLLTSDLNGAGARQLRLALWASGVQQEAARRDAEGITKVVGSGFLKSIGFESGNIFSPTDTMRAQILAEEGGERKPIGISELPEAIRAQLESTTKLMQPPGQYKEVGLTSRFLFAFVLPNGESLEPEREELGTTDKFYRPSSANSPRMELKPRSMGPFQLAKPAAKSIMLRADNATSALAALDIARTYGFSELLLWTNNPAALRACIAKSSGTGVKVSLAVRPWSAPAGAKDLDLNLMGQSGTQLSGLLNSLSSPRSDEPLSGDFASSSYNSLPPSQIQRYINLAKTSGIARVVILDPVLPGYHSESLGRGIQLARAAVEKATYLGYSSMMREQFLQRFGSDPIDIPDENLRTPIDLRQPYFADYRLGSSIGRFQRSELPSGVAGLDTAWNEFRSKASATALQGLLKSLQESKSAILVQSSPAGSRSNFRNEITASAWPEGISPDSLSIISLSGNVPSDMFEKSIAMRFDNFARAHSSTAIDLTALPSNKWTSFFARWFVRAGT